ncbi:MAG: electron transfer flavoprotein subunit alpha/FixB family protein [Candidatus Marinimicrobia bacterium]|jgi:electron transfer flavoprotein alpha subunit|nr:electron transfer flavoprotein subunit alpha/FixB family protein [Candidatus Neomarinimicrobiota bacterium]MDP6611295.1 electron transfer flavoprotein subunit alpha/FixB family protein [Candidatus Neomarinimicrobiota bacterium]|tara:strand:- start:5759 stop:6730 length:972 start_codon:yes stop_codon:yes gene_type:complete
MDILIVLEDNNGKIHRMGLESIAAAQKMANDLGLSMGALVMGKNGDALAEQASGFNVGEVIKVNNKLLSSYSSDGYAEAVKQVIEQENPTYVLFGHSYQVRDYAPRVSAKLMKPFLVDNVAMNTEGGNVVFTKQMFNAKLFSDITPVSDGPYLVSFQSAAFSSENAVSGSASVREATVNLDASMIKTESEEPFQEEAGGVDLTSAEIIVSIGRGIGKEENIPLAETLAQALGGELAASRPVVDAGWLPAAHQIGSSGQSVSPQMYLALGISGAIQHVVGMKGSKNIVAINKDPEAPIFEIADYGVVGDVLEIIPKLVESLKGD